MPHKAVSPGSRFHTIYSVAGIATFVAIDDFHGLRQSRSRSVGTCWTPGDDVPVLRKERSANDGDERIADLEEHRHIRGQLTDKIELAHVLLGDMLRDPHPAAYPIVKLHPGFAGVVQRHEKRSSTCDYKTDWNHSSEPHAEQTALAKSVMHKEQQPDR